MRKPTQRSAEMRRLVGEFERSGLSRREFCEGHEVSLTTLEYWRRRFRSESKAGMVRVKVTDAAQAAAHGFRLSLVNGRQIECAWDFADEALARLIGIAESV